MITQQRIKSIVFWCGVFSAAFMAVGYDWHNLTSWSVLGETLLNILKNPAMIIAIAINIIGQANNPTNKTGF